RLGALEVRRHLVAAQAGIKGGKEHDGAAGIVVDALRVDVFAGEPDAEARARGSADDLLANAPLPLLQELGLVDIVHGDDQATVLPSLRRTRSACSPTMRTPLPL